MIACGFEQMGLIAFALLSLQAQIETRQRRYVGECDNMITFLQCLSILDVSLGVLDIGPNRSTIASQVSNMILLTVDLPRA